jgi:predicted ATP-dependent endonuclease of OLD family
MSAEDETLKTVHIKRFKRINDAVFDLQTINVLLGANNSGKSSVIQGLHFGTRHS